MEEVPLRFPHIGEQIFEILDNKTLANCKKVCRYWNTFIEDQKFHWIRIIEEHDEKSLSVIIGSKLNISKKRKLFRKIRMKDIRKFAKKLILEEKSTRNSSLHIAAKTGEFAIFDIMLKVQRFGNPKNWMGETPLHLASQNGHLEIGKSKI